MAKPLKYTAEGIPKNWDGKDWLTYKWAMDTVFRKKKLAGIAEGTIIRSMLSSAESEEEFDHSQMKLLRLVGTSVPPDILHQIRDKTTGTEMWRAVCDLYEGRANKAVMAHRIRSRRNEIWHTKMSTGGDVNKHLSKLLNLRTELASLKYTVDDNDMIELLLESLPNQPEFENMKAAIRYSPDFGAFSPNNVRDMIRAADSRQHEFRTRDGSGSRGNQKYGGNTDSLKEKDYHGKGGKQQPASKESEKQKKQKKCYICESTGHIRAECPELNKIQSVGEAKSNDQKKKHRGNVTIRHVSRESLKENADGVVSGALDPVMVDAGIGSTANEEILDNPDREEARNEVSVDGNEREFEDTVGKWWFFDTASDIHVTGNRSYYVDFTEDTCESQSVHGVTPAMASRIAGVGTVALVTEVDGERREFRLDDVFYAPGAEQGLFSPGLAGEQGLNFEYNRETMNFRVTHEGRTLFVATPYECTWGFLVSSLENTAVLPRDHFVCNFTATEGMASLKLWHERLAHICPQYLKAMVAFKYNNFGDYDFTDKGLVREMLLRQRELGACDACQIGKQKKKPHMKKLDRKLKDPNQVMYVDLLIPSKDNGNRFEAVLVIMDGYSRFVTVHMLTSKVSSVVNDHIRAYVMWAERQAGRQKENAGRIKYMVQQVLSDKGCEFVNSEMKGWYAAHGIEHIRVGPKSSQLNLCERTHQSLVGMTKSMMYQAGFPRSLWSEAMRNAVYIKNRVFNEGTQGIPYEMMFGVKPDIHHIRKFGSLAYVHVPVTAGRHKHHDNAKIGFTLGYAEDVVGCKVYFPEERTAKSCG